MFTTKIEEILVAIGQIEFHLTELSPPLLAVTLISSA